MKTDLSSSIRDFVSKSVSLVDEASRPNCDELAVLLRDLLGMKFTIKYFGYEIAKLLAEKLHTQQIGSARFVGLASKASTQRDIESDWAAYWCRELKIARVYHRKVWEFCFVLQALYERNFLREGMRGLGFACGREPLPSYFASRGIEVTATDLPPVHSAAAGWSATSQHMSDLDTLHYPDLVDRDTLARRTKIRYVDMNDIPRDLTDFDFCWSICSLEHLGSIAKGLEFIENSLRTLKPGGVAVHTTEFNFGSDSSTIDNWGTVLFQRKHFKQLVDILSGKGYTVAPLDFDIGAEVLDRFIDVPPFPHDYEGVVKESWSAGLNHLKLSVDGFLCTCFGIIISVPN